MKITAIVRPVTWVTIIPEEGDRLTLQEVFGQGKVEFNPAKQWIVSLDHGFCVPEATAVMGTYYLVPQTDDPQGQPYARAAIRTKEAKAPDSGAYADT